MLFAGTLFLDVGRKDLYWLVGLVLALAVSLCPAVPASPWRVVAGALVLVVPMLAFARDGILRRLLVAACLLLLALAADIASLVVWYVLSAPAWASSTPQEGGWGAMIIAHSVRVVAMVGLLAPFSFAYRRMGHLHTDRGALAFGGFIVVQLILLMVAVGTLMDDEVVPSWYVMGVALATLASALVDVPLFLLLYRFNRREQQAQRAEMLQHELDHYLQQYESVEREIRLVGRLRHDLRNQSGVAMLLAQQGEVERAQEHLNMLIDEITRRSAEAAGNDGMTDGPLEEGRCFVESGEDGRPAARGEASGEGGCCGS